MTSLRQRLLDLAGVTAITVVVWLYAAGQTLQTRVIAFDVEIESGDPARSTVESASPYHLSIEISGSRQAVIRATEALSGRTIRLRTGIDGVPAQAGVHELAMRDVLELSDDEKAAGGEALRDAVAAMLDARAAGGDGAAAAAAVDAERLAVVDAKLGYFSRMLKEETAVEAVRAVVVLLSVVGWYTVVFLGGSVGLVVLIVFLASGRTRATLAPASDLRVGVVLGETFVLWFALFLGLTVAMQFVGGGLGTEGRLVLSLFAMFASLAALAYPIMRGIPAAELRRAIGLHAGTGLLREAGWGALCYLTAVPLLAVGLAMFALLSWISTQVFGEQAEPSHPAVEMLADSSALRIVLLYTLASVAAPIVEEIAFRGVFYGHLRAVFAPHRRLLSAFVAAAFSSFVFAVIHPQGVLFVPALGGLAIGFCLYREWRSSLVAPMVAHGINNAVTMTIGLLLLS